MSIFLFPHNIPSGGGAGLAILMNRFLGLPLGFGLWLANAIFLLFAVNYFGFTWTVKTICSVGITATTVSILKTSLILPHWLLPMDLLFGGIFYGIGVGILVRVGASSGGMVVPALMIAKWKNWNPGRVIFLINFCIFIITSLVIDYKIVIFAILCQYISSNVIDFIYHFRMKKWIPIFQPSWRKK